MKKSQATMEFFMTYGWAILVVLAAIGALAYFGALHPNNFSPNATVEKYMNETDGINSNGFLCYNKEGVTLERQAYIMIHELCHEFIDEDKKHFCGS